MSARRRPSSTWPGLLLAVVVGVGAVFTARAVRPEQAPLHIRGLMQLRRHPAFRDARPLPAFSDLLAAAEADVPPELMRIARVEHIAISECADVHALHAAYVERRLALDPDLALSLGEAIGKTTSIDELSRGRWLVLLADVHAALGRTPRGEIAAAHDATDRALLRASLEMEVRLSVDDEHNALAWIGSWIDALPLLTLRENLPPEIRAELAAQRLEALPGRLDEALAELERPPIGLTLQIVDRLAAFRGSLLTVDSWFPGLDAALESRLEGAAAEAAMASRRAERRLREELAPDGRPTSGIGLVAFEGLLRHGHLLDVRAEDALDRALERMRDATWRMGQLSLEGASDPVPVPDPVSLIADLRERLPTWIADVPDDPGLATRPCPAAWDDGSAGAYYLARAPRGRPMPGFLLLIPDAAGDDATEPTAATWFEHMLAHETYPGHHVHALFVSETCSVRQFHEDSVMAEGWATYAEGLAHDTDYCRGDEDDAYRHAASDWDVAWVAAFDVAAQSGLVNDATLAGWLRSAGFDDADVATVGAHAATPGGGLAYLIGLDAVREIVAIERAERRRAASLPEIHRDMLRAGALPPSLLKTELRALRASAR